MNALKISIGVLSGILVVLLVIIYLSVQNMQELQGQLDNCHQEVRQLEDQLDEQAAKLQHRDEEDDNLVSFKPFSDYELRRFAEKQITEPISFLRDRLQDRPDLIPTEAVLGGTMNFYDREAIHVLNDKWVFATFEDGHIMGQILLGYDIDADLEIEWGVIDVVEK